MIAHVLKRLALGGVAGQGKGGIVHSVIAERAETEPRAEQGPGVRLLAVGAGQYSGVTVGQEHRPVKRVMLRRPTGQRQQGHRWRRP